AWEMRGNSQILSRLSTISALVRSQDIVNTYAIYSKPILLIIVSTNGHKQTAPYWNTLAGNGTPRLTVSRPGSWLRLTSKSGERSRSCLAPQPESGIRNSKAIGV